MTGSNCLMTTLSRRSNKGEQKNGRTNDYLLLVLLGGVAVQKMKPIWGNGLVDGFVRRCACPLCMCVALRREKENNGRNKNEIKTKRKRKEQFDLQQGLRP